MAGKCIVGAVPSLGSASLALPIAKIVLPIAHVVLVARLSRPRLTDRVPGTTLAAR